MGFFTSLVDAFRMKPRARESIPLDAPRRNRQAFQESSSRHPTGHASQNTFVSGPAQNPSDLTHASKKKSMSRRRSWFGGRIDADEDVPAVPTLVHADYYQLPEDKHVSRTAVSSHRQNATTVEALPPLPSIPVQTDYVPQEPATSTLPAEQRRSRRVTMKPAPQRSNSRASTRSKRKSRSFWASSNPDDSDSDVPPVPDLSSVTTTPASTCSNPFEDFQSPSPIPGNNGTRQPRPVSTASRKSYTPRSAAAGFLKSTNGASEHQRKSYRRSFNLGEGVELVCVTDEHRIEWERLMNKNARLEDSVFASSMGRRTSKEEQTGDRFSNAQALAALEFGVRA